MAVFHDRIKQSGIIEASGDIRLTGQFLKFESFPAVFAPSSVFNYAFEFGGTSGAWETGWGTISGGTGANPSYIVRHEIYESSQNNEKVNVPSGDYIIFSTPPAKHIDELNYLGFL